MDPALRHKAPQSDFWLLLRHPVGTLKSRRLWSRGQHGPQKTRRDTVDGICWYIFGDLFRRNTVTSEAGSASCREGAGQSQRRRTRVLLTPNQEETTFISAASSDIALQLDATCNTGCLSPRDVVVRHLESTGSCSADLPGDMHEPEQTVQRPHSRFKSGTLAALARSVQISISVFKVGLWLYWFSQCRFPEPPLHAFSGGLSRVCRGCLGLHGTYCAQISSMRAVDW